MTGTTGIRKLTVAMFPPPAFPLCYRPPHLFISVHSSPFSSASSLVAR